MKPLDEPGFKGLASMQVTIVGAGLMGSSLALALRGAVAKLTGVDRSAAHREAASAYFDTITDELNAAVADADLVILATPIRAILAILDQMANGAIPLKPGAILIDLGSTKAQIAAAMDCLPNHVMAVACHPMCGKETSGPDSADGALYQNKVFVLCPTTRSTPDSIALARRLIETVGARPVRMDAITHDRAVAAISHLPYMVSAGLVAAVGQIAAEDDIPWQLAASGFRDTSRLAASDVIMMGDTLITNREAVLIALNVFQERLDVLRELLARGEDSELRAMLEAIKQVRVMWGNNNITPTSAPLSS